MICTKGYCHIHSLAILALKVTKETVKLQKNTEIHHFQLNENDKSEKSFIILSSISKHFPIVFW